MRERESNSDTSIAFTWADTGPTVTKIVDAMAAQGSESKIDKSSVVTERRGADAGRSYYLSDASQSRTRLHGGEFFTLQCIHESRGTRLAAALHAQ